MKKNIIIIQIVIALLGLAGNVKAQSFEKGAKYRGIALGGSNMFHLYNNNYIRMRYTPITGQFIYQYEKAVHDYVGVGFFIGFGGRAAGGSVRAYGAEANMLVGMITNFHFYQLIADKSGKNIHADKLDIYAGVNVGGGVAVVFSDWDGIKPLPMVFGGFQTGVRYFFTPKVAVNLEVGYGKTFVNGGLTFKAGK